MCSSRMAGRGEGIKRCKDYFLWGIGMKASYDVEYLPLSTHISTQQSQPETPITKHVFPSPESVI
jgi:hypothetical protein